MDRLERATGSHGDRGPADRRSAGIRVLPDRSVEAYRLYRGMNSAMDEICAGYTEDELDLSAGFLQRSTEAGRESAGKLG